MSGRVISPARLAVWRASVGKGLPQGHGLPHQVDPRGELLNLPGETGLALHAAVVLLLLLAGLYLLLDQLTCSGCYSLQLSCQLGKRSEVTSLQYVMDSTFDTGGLGM